MLLVVAPGSGDGTGRQSQELTARQAVVCESQAAIYDVRHVRHRGGFPHPSVRALASSFGSGAGAFAAVAVQDLVELGVLHEPLGGGLPGQVVSLLGGQGLRVAGHGFLHFGDEVLGCFVGQAVGERPEEVVRWVVGADHKLAHG